MAAVNADEGEREGKLACLPHQYANESRPKFVVRACMLMRPSRSPTASTPTARGKRNETSAAAAPKVETIMGST